MKRFAVVFLTAACVSCAATLLKASNFADTYGLSSRSIGMANAVTATANDWTSLWYNPAGLGKTYTLPSYNIDEDGKVQSFAGLTEETGTTYRQRLLGFEASEGNVYFPGELALTILYTSPMMDLDIPRDGVYADEDLDFGVIIVGFVFDINSIVAMPDFISSARIGIALGTGLDGWMYKINDISPMTHNYLRYGREAQRTIILMGAGLGFLDDLFGVGLAANIQNRSEARTRLEGLLLDPEVQSPQGQSRMTTEVRPFLNAGLYVNPVGIAEFFDTSEEIIDILSGLEIGVSYRMETEMETYPFISESVMEVGSIDVPVSLAMYDYYSPHIISTGIAYTRFDLTASINIDYEMWSGFNLGRAYKDGVYYYDPDDPEEKIYVPLKSMNDIVTFRLGMAYDVKRWVEGLTVFTGYYYQPSFVPDSAVKGDFNFLDNDKHVASIGAEYLIPNFWRFAGPVEINFAYQFQYLVPRDVKKTDLVITEPDKNPDYSYGGMCHTLTAGVGIKF